MRLAGALPAHEHVFKRVAIPDSPSTKAEAIQARNYDKGPRWIVAFKCQVPDCEETRAVDLTHERPQAQQARLRS